MKAKSLVRIAALALVAVPLASNALAQQFVSRASGARGSSTDDVAGIAAEAFVFGYPIVSMAVTKRVMTNVAAPQPNGRAPVNQFASLYSYPTAAFKDVVAPNVNTLYSSVWLDLSSEPLVIHLPDTKGRYDVVEVLDMWTNVFAAPGKRTTGTMAQDILITGPRFSGQTPAGIAHTYVAPTNEVWIIVRIEAKGAKDYPVVNALQRQLSVTPMSSFRQPYTPPAGNVDPNIDMSSPLKQVNAMSAETFFNNLAKEMATNGVGGADSSLLARMASIGIMVGQPFTMSNMQGDMAADIRRGAKQGLEQISKHAMSMGTMTNGWHVLPTCGNFGSDFLTRAAVALVGLGCNLPEDAVYPKTTVDSQGQPLTGEGGSKYVLHFATGQTPPVMAFWSLTMYDSSSFLVANPINRYAVSSYDAMKRNADGSLTIYIQRESPGPDKQANWLPAPNGKFVLMLREYWPKENARTGAWMPPAVQKMP
jgi:DNA sulfur modification protein DndE